MTMACANATSHGDKVVIDRIINRTVEKVQGIGDYVVSWVRRVQVNADL
jgi:hypothetical protein